MSSLRDALQTAFDAEAETPELEVLTPAPAETVEATPEPARANETDAEARARDDKGRYAAKEAVKDNVVPIQQNLDIQPEKKAPSSWKPDAQAAYLKASKGEALTPEEIRLITGEADRRESDFHKGVSEFKSHADRARGYDQAIQPYAQYLQSLNLDAPTAISSLLRVEHTLRTADPITKAQEFSRLAQEYGIDLAQVAQMPPPDPQTQYLMQELQNLRNQQNLWQNQQNQQTQSVSRQEIEQFSNGKPHFEAVRLDMADLLETGKAKDMNEAYDMAVWMRPEIRTTLIDQQRAEVQKKADEQMQAQRAKAAAVSVKGSSPVSSGVQPLKGSLRDVIAAQFADS